MIAAQEDFQAIVKTGNASGRSANVAKTQRAVVESQHCTADDGRNRVGDEFASGRYVTESYEGQTAFGRRRCAVARKCATVRARVVDLVAP
jgi:hypothetical protein